MRLFHVLINCHLFMNCMLRLRRLTQHAIEKNQLFDVSALQ